MAFPRFRAVNTFSLYSGVGVAFIYAWTLTFFGGCIAASAHAGRWWARRERGLIIGREMAGKIKKIEDLRGRRIVPRQAEAGSQGLLEHLLGQANIARNDVEFIAPCRTETDAALAVLEGKADAALGLKMLADQYRLDFAPVMSERFDLLVDRRAWFEPPMQTFLDFCRSDSFLAKVRDMPGYDVSPLGCVHFNGA